MGSGTARARHAITTAALAAALVGTAACAPGGAPDPGGTGGSGVTGGPGGSGAATAAGPDPALRPYCDTIVRVQSEQSAPGVTDRPVAEAAAETRRQLGEVVAVAPPQIVAEWRTVQLYTEQSLASLEATGGDAELIDRAELQRLQDQAGPSVDRIRSFTEQGCEITFRTPG